MRILYGACDFFQLVIYGIVYRVIEIAKECSVKRSLLTFHQAPGEPRALLATHVQDLQENAPSVSSCYRVQVRDGVDQN